MNELLFCEKCGHISSADSNEKGSLCLACAMGNYIGTNLEFKKVDSTTRDEYRRLHDGNYPAWYDAAEIVREKYFYNKLDYNINAEAIDKRKRFERPELYPIQKVEEANRRWRQQRREPSGPKCPICGSTNLTKITATRKILKVGLFGRLGTGDLGKTYQCGSCGAKF